MNKKPMPSTNITLSAVLIGVIVVSLQIIRIKALRILS